MSHPNDQPPSNPGDPASSAPTRRKKRRSSGKPRVVKKREYRLFRVHARGSLKTMVNSAVDCEGMAIEEVPGTHPDRGSARKWLEENAKEGEEYFCAAVLFVATAVQKTAIEIE